MARHISIYGPDAVAALLVRHAASFVRDGIRGLGDYDKFSRREVVDEAIRHLSSEAGVLENLAMSSPSERHWQDERDALLAIVAFLRTMLPAETTAQPTEGVSAC